MSKPDGLLYFVIGCSIVGSVSAAATAADSANRADQMDSVYQWSAVVEGFISPESKDHPRAFLWIPPDCRRVRAIVIADQNMEEEQVFQNPEFRRTLTELGFAEIWMAPAMGTADFQLDKNDPQVLEAILQSLADRSGYGEITTAPLVPTGHSATASWCWDVAASKPERTLAVLSLSGQWPYFTSKAWGDRNIDQVPGLTTKGEFEIQGNLEKGWYAGLKGDSYQKHPHQAFTQVVEPGDGHFSASKEKIELINLFLKKAAQYRLPKQIPAQGPVALTPIDASKQGWMFDVWHRDAPPSAPAAPVAQYTGKPENAFWAFDEEMARAIEAFQGRFRGQPPVLIGYKQASGLTTPIPDHAMVHLKFEPIEDGLTFKLTGGFWDKVPATKDNKRAEWQGWLGEGVRTVNQNDPITHPQDEADKFAIAPICGPVVQSAPDTFHIRFNRIGFNNPKRANDIWLYLTYSGDGHYRKMVQQAELRFPLWNTKGKPQAIDFPAIPDQLVQSVMPAVKMSATSNAGTTVYYYVREGPALVDDRGNLLFTTIPSRSKFPISVTVVAWQWGRSIEPLIQSAQPVERSFVINGPAH